VPRHSWHTGYGLRDLRRVMTGPAYARVLADAVARFVPCDTVVFTRDWIPDHELARLAGLAMDPGTRGPAVDITLETSAAGVFAAGNLVHAAETADIAALSGRHAAPHIAARLGAGPLAAGASVPGSGVREAGLPILVEPPLRWISPNAITSPVFGATPPLGRFVLRSCDFRRLAQLEVRQDGRLLARSRRVRLVPERPVHLGAGWLGQVDLAGGPVRVTTGS
jgi:hypothetical protein